MFCINIYNNGIIRLRIYTDSINQNLIENIINHKIKFIEENKSVLIKASRIENGKVIKKYFISSNYRIDYYID